MADKMISCKEAIASFLCSKVKEDRRIMVLCSDSKGSGGLTEYAKTNPDNFIESGIAEQDEIGIAAGLAVSGLKPIVSAPGSFLSARSLEQIKVDVAYSHKNVKIIAVSSGVSYGVLGASHHTLHDIAALRAIPDLELYVPSDAIQATAIMKSIINSNKAAYIRIGRSKVPVLYSSEAEAYTPGQMNMLKQGYDLTIIACGETVHHALVAAEVLMAKGYSIRVLDAPFISNLDKKAVLSAANETKRVLTVEEHNINGGLGAAIAQIIAGETSARVKTIGFPDEYLITGTSEELFSYYGLDAAGIAKTAEKMLLDDPVCRIRA